MQNPVSISIKTSYCKISRRQRIPPLPNDYPYHWVILDPKSKEDKVKVTNLKNSPKFQIFKFWNGHYTRHTFWSCLIRCANMKWIRWVLLKIQSGHDSVHRWTDGQGDTSIPPFQLRWSGGIKTHKSPGFDTLEDLTIRRLIGYWYRTQATQENMGDTSHELNENVEQPTTAICSQRASNVEQPTTAICLQKASNVEHPTTAICSQRASNVEQPTTAIFLQKASNAEQPTTAICSQKASNAEQPTTAICSQRGSNVEQPTTAICLQKASNAEQPTTAICSQRGSNVEQPTTAICLQKASNAEQPTTTIWLQRTRNVGQSTTAI